MPITQREEGTLTERVQHWESEQEYLWDRLYCCIDFHIPLPAVGCEYSDPYREEPEPVGEYRDRHSEISVQNLPAGIYFLQMEDEKGEKKTVKVVVAHGKR